MMTTPTTRMRWFRSAAFAAAALSLIIVVSCGGSGTPGPQAAPLSPQAQWFKDKARPLTTTSPEASDADLAFLPTITSSARIVGMGEATHGSHEFQAMKDRVFRSLVARQGYTVFGLEAQMGLCRAIDRYIQTGEGDPIAALKGQRFWVWSTEEMLALVKWMRAYNQDPAHATKLRFFGFDMQDGGEEIDQVVAFVQRVDPQAAGQVASWYASFLPFTWKGTQDYQTADPALRAECRANVQSARDWMISHEAAYAALAGAEEAAWAVQLARVVVQSEAVEASNQASSDPYNLRDLYMADNVAWYSALAGPATRMVLSAHNGHVNRTSPWFDEINMGEHLATRLGAGYFTLGFAFDEGGLLAFNMDTQKLMVNTARPAGTGSYEETFRQSGLELAFLDMRNLDMGQPGAAWMAKPHPLREVGSGWRDLDGFNTMDTVLPNRFDSLVWIRKVKATTLLK